MKTKIVNLAGLATIVAIAITLFTSSAPSYAGNDNNDHGNKPPSSACVPAAVPYSTQFSLEGAVNSPKTFDYNALKQYAPSKENVAYYSGSAGLVSKSYIGVLLYDLLNEAGVITNPSIKNDLNRKYIVITATDCYQTIVSFAEIDPTFGSQLVMVAYEKPTVRLSIPPKAWQG